MTRTDGLLRWIVYPLLVLAAVLSFLAAYIIPVTDTYKAFISSAGVTALFGMVWQALRDKDTFDRNRELKVREQAFGLGVVSHMADVVFDKQVEFSEKYAQYIQKAKTRRSRDRQTKTT